jgi:hypothetical protein
MDVSGMNVRSGIRSVSIGKRSYVSFTSRNCSEISTRGLAEGATLQYTQEKPAVRSGMNEDFCPFALHESVVLRLKKQ